MNRIQEALLLEIVATGTVEGIYYGPEWCRDYIEALILEAGGWDVMVERLGQSWDGPLDG